MPNLSKLIVLLLLISINASLSLSQTCVDSCTGSDGHVYRIQIQADSNSYALNKPLKLKCDVQPLLSSVRYEWFKNGKVVQYGDLLDFSIFSKDDFGNYKCVASGRNRFNEEMTLETSRTIYGSVEQTTYKLKIESSPKIFEINQNLVLKCVLSPSADDIRYSWYKDGRFVSSGPELVFARFGQHDMGTYKCVADVTGTDGAMFKVESERWFRYKEENTSVQLGLKHQLNIEANYQRVAFGQNLVLKCNLSPFESSAVYSWYKNNEPLSLSSDQTLFINNFAAKDAALYKCISTGRTVKGLRFHYESEINYGLQTIKGTEPALSIMSVPTQPQMGESLNLECVLRTREQKQEVSFIWYHNNQFVSYGRNLHIPRLTREKAGSYKCVCMDSHSDSINLHTVFNTDLNLQQRVAYELQIVSTPDQPTINQPLRLDCRISPTSPSSTVIWYHNNKFIGYGNRFVVDSFTAAQNGDYKCVYEFVDPSGSLVNKETIRRFETKFDYAVSIESRPEAPKIGGRLELECQGANRNSSKVIWYKNGLFHSFDRVLVINHLERSDSGQYKCVVECAEAVSETVKDIKIEEEAEEVTVTVVSEPEIPEIGKRWSLKCEDNKGRANVNSTWLKNGKYYKKGWKVDIDIFRSEDNGEYTCVCEGVNSVVANVKVVKVEEKKKELEIVSRPKVPEVGKHWVMECRVRDGEANVNVIWYKDGVLFQRGSRIEISKFSAQNGGQYKCMCDGANDRATLVEAQPKRLEVAIVSRPGVPEVGKKWLLECRDKNGFRSDVSAIWYKNGQFLKSGLSIEASSFSVEENGEYKCVLTGAEDGLSGEETQRVVGKKSYRVHIETRPSDEPEEGQRMVLRCVVEPSAVTEAKVEWFKNNKRLSVSMSSELVIEEASVSDGGVYECNTHGVSNSKVIRVRQKPSPYQVSIDVVTSRVRVGKTMEMACRVRPVGTTATYKWFRDGTEVWRHGQRVVIEELTEDDLNRSYKCVATVETETGAKMDLDTRLHLHLHLHRSDFSLAIESSSKSGRVKAGSSLSLRCVLQPLGSGADVEWTWFRDGKKLQEGRAELTIQRTSKHDSGRYRCLALVGTSDGHSFELEAATTVMVELSTEAAVRKSVQVSMNRIGSTSIKLVCAVSGDMSMTLAFNWFKAGKLVKVGRELLIESLLSCVLGKYHCRVSSKTGQVVGEDSIVVDRGNLATRPGPCGDRSERLEHRHHVNINQSPRDGTVHAGQVVTLSCSVQPSTAAWATSRYQWTRNGRVISTSAELVLPQTSTTDSGQYRCIAEVVPTNTETAPFVLDATHNLQVNEVVQKISHKKKCQSSSCYGVFPVSQSVQRGQTVFFYCHLQKSGHRYSQSDLTWFLERDDDKGHRQRLRFDEGAWRSGQVRNSENEFFIWNTTPEITDTGFVYCRDPSGHTSRGRLTVLQ